MFKSKRFFNSASAIVLVLILLSGCHPVDPLSGIDDFIDQIPGMSIVDGADRITINVNRNGETAYYNVNLGNFGEGLQHLGGDYKAWCTQWDISIGSNNATYEGAKMYHIVAEDYWKNLVYLVNESARYMEADSTLKWTEVQVAIWAVINYKKIELDEAFISRLDREFRDVRLAAVQQLLEDVQTKVTSWDNNQLDYDIFYVEVASDVQDLVVFRPKE
jgi:hypothetical protein